MHANCHSYKSNHFIYGIARDTRWTSPGLLATSGYRSIAISTMDTICARTMDGTKSTRGASSELSNARVAGRCEGQIANLESAHTHSRYESKAIRELWRTSRGNPAGLGSETTLFEQSTAILFLSQIPQRQWRLTGPRLPHGTSHITTCRRWAFGLATSIDSCLHDGRV